MFINKKIRINFLSIILFLSMVTSPFLVRAQQTSIYVQNALDLLNKITTLQADFVQVSPTGTIETGIFYIDRPGRLRIAYNPPSPILIVAGHGLLVYYNSKLGQVTNIPLSSTILGFLLSPHVTLGTIYKAVQVTNSFGQIRIKIIKVNHPELGSITLVFSQAPFILRQWVISDAQDQITTVSLDNIQQGMTLDQSLFSFVNPTFFQTTSPGP